MENIPQTNFIRYNPERVDYTLTGEELEQLKSSMQNSWKDFCIACLALGFPCLINAISEASQQKVFSPTLSFNLNLVIGLIGVLFGIIFLILWQKTKGSCDRVIEKIINKPKISIVPSGIGINQVMINSETIGKSNKRISKQ
jgi:hypothetical protein